MVDRQLSIVRPERPPRVIRVSADLIAAARLRELLDRRLGRPVDPVIAGIARSLPPG